MKRAVCLALALAAPAAAEPLPAADVAAIDAALAAAVAEDNLPGAAVGVWIGDRGEYVTAQGSANLADGLARRPEDQFRIGSVTKPMIATVILQLADEGKLSVDDPITTWFPAFEGGATVTVDDLLRMRSGLPEVWGEEALAALFAHPLEAPGMDEMIARAAADPSRRKPPGAETVYTNLNYLMLDRIIAKTTGQTTAAALEARIFAPLGMTRSLLPDAPDLPGPLRGYALEGDAFVDVTALDVRAIGGAGAAISTLSDLAAFVRALCEGALISPEAQTARLRGDPIGGGQARYGEGVVTLGPFCGHNGTIFGFSTEAWMLPERDAVIIVNVNRLDADDVSRSSDLFGRVVRALFPDVLK